MNSTVLCKQQNVSTMHNKGCIQYPSKPCENGCGAQYFMFSRECDFNNFPPMIGMKNK
jgi:hypothetical protein